MQAWEKLPDESPWLLKTIEVRSKCSYSSCYHNHASLLNWERDLFFIWSKGNYRIPSLIIQFLYFIDEYQSCNQSSLADLQSGLKCLVQKIPVYYSFQNHHVFSRKKKAKIYATLNFNTWPLPLLTILNPDALRYRHELRRVRTTSLPVFQTAQSPRQDGQASLSNSDHFPLCHFWLLLLQWHRLLIFFFFNKNLLTFFRNTFSRKSGHQQDWKWMRE